jgi:hypothetical protein
MMANVDGSANVRRTPAMGLGLPSGIIGRLSRNSVGTRRGRAHPRLGDRPDQRDTFDRLHQHLKRLADEVEQAMKSGKQSAR